MEYPRFCGHTESGGYFHVYADHDDPDEIIRAEFSTMVEPEDLDLPKCYNSTMVLVRGDDAEKRSIKQERSMLLFFYL